MQIKRATTFIQASIIFTAVCGGMLPAFAQGQAKPMNSAPTAMGAPHAYYAVRAGDLIGMNVQGSQKKSVGEIKDLIINVNTGDVRYALLEFDPGFFKSEKLFAVPINALTMGADRKTLSYQDMSRDKLEKAGVDKADWQKAVDNRRYIDGLDKNYGFQQPTGTAVSMRASKLIGKDVNSHAGKDIGKIKELVIDMSTAKVHYAVLAFDPSWISSEKLFAFPLTAFKMTADKDDLVLDVDKSMIAAMKSFDAKRWGSLNDLNRDDFINPAPASKK